ncbi:MAG: glycine--tRNA ligase subunit beta [Cyanobium sp.]
MATFLLEIGTEELPADFARLALPQLREIAAASLSEQRLTCSGLKTTGTPRRLALQVEGLPLRQEDACEERKGPPAQQAFRDGQPTPAAIGFARRCGLDPAALEVRDTPRGPFVFATTVTSGRATAEVLAELIPQWISALQGRRFMRWGQGEQRFSRPIRWLVALLDAEVVPVQLDGCDPPLHSGRCSRGHRLHGASGDGGAVAIATASSYGETLAAAGVLVERQERAALIRRELEAAAAARGGQADLPEGLFEELVDLVEAPRLLEGSIEERFLALPPEVLCTVMRAHQRYVPLQRIGAAVDPLALDAQASLLPRFLCIGNGLEAASATIRRGNERVLRARLADAEFFVAADRRVASIDRRDQLATVTFAEGLGSLRDRCERLEWCVDILVPALGLAAADAGHARRAAHLCKHDLVSQMVGEFPELQGQMGGKYLLAEGEPRAVALAVLEHYLPRGAGDTLPTSAAGAVLALAERLELLLSIFARGERPSGSSDPYALRRAGNGLLQILGNRGWSPDLAALLQRACGHWQQLFPAFALKADALADDLGEFLRQRLQSLLEEEGIDADLVQAVSGASVSLQRLLADPLDARQRATLLQQLRRDGALQAVQAVVQRASRLAEKGEVPLAVLSPRDLVDARLFSSPSEAAMLAVLERLEPIAAGAGSERYGLLAAALRDSASTLAAFFDGEQSVLVMADDLAVRANRLALLALLRNQASVLADFSCLNA